MEGALLCIPRPEHLKLWPYTGDGWAAKNSAEGRRGRWPSFLLAAFFAPSASLFVFRSRLGLCGAESLCLRVSSHSRLPFNLKRSGELCGLRVAGKWILSGQKADQSSFRRDTETSTRDRRGGGDWRVGELALPRAPLRCYLNRSSPQSLRKRQSTAALQDAIARVAAMPILDHGSNFLCPLQDNFLQQTLPFCFLPRVEKPALR